MALDTISCLLKSMGEMPLFVLFKGTRNVFRNDELGQEIMQIALPTALALTADPIASLIDTAFIGHIGPVELAAVGVSIAVFNQVSKIAIFPLVSVTTSFVAEEDATKSLSIEADDSGVLEMGYAVNQEMELEDLRPKVGSTCKSSLITSSYRKTNDRRQIPSASAALVIGSVLGIIQALFLIFAAKPILNYMGVESNSPMLKPAQQYLTLRSLGAPAVLLSLAMQGVFRGFKDTKTPLFAILVGDVANIILDPIFIFILGMGVSGAAIAHVISQYLISLMLLWRLIKEVDLLPPSINDLQIGRFLKNGMMTRFSKQKLAEAQEKKAKGGIVSGLLSKKKAGDVVKKDPAKTPPAKRPASPTSSLEMIASGGEEIRKKKKAGGKSFLPSYLLG